MTDTTEKTCISFSQFETMVKEGIKEFSNLSVEIDKSVSILISFSSFNNVKFVYGTHKLTFEGLIGCEFNNCDFQNVVITEKSRSYFIKCRFDIVEFSTEFQNSHFEDCTISYSSFDKDIGYTNFNNSKVINTRFVCLNFIKGTLSKCSLYSVDIINCTFEEVSIEESLLEGCIISDSRLKLFAFIKSTIKNLGLYRCIFRESKMIYCDFSNLDCTNSAFGYLDISGTTGFIKSSDFMNRHFKKDDKGYIVFKVIGKTDFPPNKNWKIEEGSYIEENVDTNRFECCGCGVNFGTLAYVRSLYPYGEVWECRIDFTDAAGIIVPYNSDGKARCERLYLTRKMKPEEYESV